MVGMRERPPTPHEQPPEQEEWKLLSRACEVVHQSLRDMLVEEVLNHFFPHKDRFLDAVTHRVKGASYTLQPSIWVAAVRNYLACTYPPSAALSSIHRLLEKAAQEEAAGERKEARRNLATFSYAAALETVIQQLGALHKPTLIQDEAFQTEILRHMKPLSFWQAQRMEAEEVRPYVEKMKEQFPFFQESLSSAPSDFIDIAEREMPRLLEALSDPSGFRRSVVILVHEFLVTLFGLAFFQASKRALERYEEERGTPQVTTSEDRALLNTFFLEEVQDIFSPSLALPPA